jgi:DUF2075 family protein
MIVYQSTKQGFDKDIINGDIEDTITNLFLNKLSRKVAGKEKESWKNSLHYMNTVLNDSHIPYNTGITIECQLPQSNKRIDFIITGRNREQQDHVIIIELKQWQSAELTEKDAMVKTPLGKGFHESCHPSYQAWSYASFLYGFNETVQKEKIQLVPCAYLHNYEEDKVITNPFYQQHLDKAPVFFRKDIAKLRDFIKNYITTGDDGEIMYRIDQGKVRPSKMLADALASMIKGNEEFILLDQQKEVYETALYLSRQKQKQVLIIEGGPGTGKSVVAINLLVGLTKLKKLVHYVSKNAAPRAVYASKLTGVITKTAVSNLFKGSGRYLDIPEDTFDALVVDEAHRLNEKSGLYGNLGENQIKEIIRASKLSIFFIDEDQRVTLKDIGTKDEIKKWANQLGVSIHEAKLDSQFRCNGSDGYLAWLDQKLQIRETANDSIQDLGYDFKVVDSPNELYRLIDEKNKANNKARLVAGYCWDWNSKKNKVDFDIVIPEHNFSMRWNLEVDGGLWIQVPSSINEVGCIHTCQGLELNYIGVIIGNDLIVRDGKVLVDPSKRSTKDQSIKGYKKMFAENPEKAQERIRTIIKNTYRTLMTRGMKGCYVYCTDKETEEYFKKL